LNTGGCWMSTWKYLRTMLSGKHRVIWMKCRAVNPLWYMHKEKWGRYRYITVSGYDTSLPWEKRDVSIVKRLHETYLFSNVKN
jgi:hypothetical protein